MREAYPQLDIVEARSALSRGERLCLFQKDPEGVPHGLLRLPNRLEREKTREPSSRECPAHRAWVRRHHCCVPGCLGRPIECAHVRRDTDGGVALKPSDCWSISLCRDHHLEQHQVGELAFERRYGVTYANWPFYSPVDHRIGSCCDRAAVERPRLMSAFDP